MYKISNPIWYLVIGIVALAVFYFIGRNSGKKAVIKTISMDPGKDHTQENDREAKKRDFNDLNSLISELKESENTLEHQKQTK